ncbi:MAG: DMT family transporter [Rhizobacter sp.]
MQKTETDKTLVYRRGAIEWSLAGFFQVMLAAVIRHLRSLHVTTAQLMLISFAGRIVVGVCWGLATVKNFSFLKLRHPGLVTGRSLVVFAAQLCNIEALKLLPLTTYTALTFLWPVLLTAWAGIRGESTSRWIWVGLGVSLTGVVVQTGMTAESLRSVGVLWMLTSAVFNVMNVRLGQQAIDKGERPETSLFWTSVAGLLVVGLWWMAKPSIFGPLPAAAGVLLPVLVGVLSALVQGLLTLAFRHGRLMALRLLPFQFLQLVWSVLLDVFVLHLHLPVTVWIGAALAISGVMFDRIVKLRELKK